MTTPRLRWVIITLLGALPFSLVLGTVGTIDEAHAEARGGAIGKAVKGDIETLIGYCQSNDINKAAGYVVYRGPNKARRWRDVSDPSNADERRQVEGVCARVKGLVDGSTGREFVEYSSERESEGTWHIWKISFQGSAPQNVIFAMLKVKGRYALADID